MKRTVEQGIYEGYIWLSDQQEPIVYINENMPALELDDEINPFVIEAQLYETEKGISYSIKYVDGEYKITRYVLSELEKQPSKIHLYYPNRMSTLPKGTRLMFAQYWKAVPDAMCEGMEVLQPDKLVFKGFARKEDDK